MPFSNVTIENSTISDSYTGIDCKGGDSVSYANISIHNNTIHDIMDSESSISIEDEGYNQNNINIYDNKIYNVEWAWLLGDEVGGSTLTDCNISNNL